MSFKENLTKYRILIAGILIQTVLGGIYAWSIFTPSLMEHYGLYQGQTAFLFGIQISVLTLAMIPGGRLLNKIGPKKTASLGAILYILGYFVAGFSQGNFALLVLGLSILNGAGIGLGYVCPLTIGMRWFPNNKGLITGVSVAGFGAGAIVLSSWTQPLLDANSNVLHVFIQIGIISGGVFLAGAQLLKNPPGFTPKIPTTIHSPSVSLLKKISVEYPEIYKPQFSIAIVGIFAGTFSGLLVIGNLVPLAESNHIPHNYASLGVSLFALGNAFGRIIWGHISDALNALSIPLSLLLFAITLPALLLLSSSTIYLVAALLLGFGFGANFVIYAGAISDFFGMDKFPKLYPICFLGYGLAGLLGPAAGGFIADFTQSYNTGIVLSSVLSLLVAVWSYLKLKRFKSLVV